MMASIRFRQSLGNLLIAALIALPAASFARDPVPPFGFHSQKPVEDNVATDTSTAPLDDTVKWLTDNLLKNGSSRYTKVVTISGISTPLRTTEAVTGVAVKGDMLDLIVVSSFSSDGPVKTEVTESLSIPLRQIKHVSTSDGEPGLASVPGSHSQFAFVTVSLVCEHNQIVDNASTRTTSNDDPPTVSRSADVVRELNIHIDQNFEYAERLAKAIRHLAKLARTLPVGNAAEPF